MYKFFQTQANSILFFLIYQSLQGEAASNSDLASNLKSVADLVAGETTSLCHGFLIKTWENNPHPTVFWEEDVEGMAHHWGSTV